MLAPEVGFLWTPGWWGWGGSAFIFHAGYWGPQVGFYGGVSYGFGYFGRGYEGGRWDNGHFFYNRSVNNVNVTVVHNVYNTTIVNRTDVRVSYNGGNGGINERPTREEEWLLSRLDTWRLRAATRNSALRRTMASRRLRRRPGRLNLAVAAW